MATALASQRAVPRILPLLKAPKRSPAATKLINKTHKLLYPHLYTQKELDAKEEKVVVSLGKPPRHQPWERRPREIHQHPIQIYKPKPSPIKACPDPVATITATHIAKLDPTGARTRLFARTNPECARVGDILLVRLRTGDPFAGVCINIRRRGVDTSILLRGQLTRIGVEMWYKIYSPVVEGIEVVQRAQKRARRARLTYMREVKHDRGSVENVVRGYLRQKAALGSGEKTGRGPILGSKGVGGGHGGKKVKGRGKGLGKKR
ncbi:hypothetical protein P154DRAFT_557703 [Amniculicola lignicola CBS 123094]|uniref:Mitochondrial ribosomal protein-like protein n=1 Tax=Amniculicola lignicola CBS 123094 TaxID=1392246 RepID=A0A6A5VXN8_9PLEO|nr:hypothetical protein P154DRAFT_557703 [Amniculicola lignicola CBS 123094]